VKFRYEVCKICTQRYIGRYGCDVCWYEGLCPEINQQQWYQVLWEFMKDRQGWTIKGFGQVFKLVWRRFRRM